MITVAYPKRPSPSQVVLCIYLVACLVWQRKRKKKLKVNNQQWPACGKKHPNLFLDRALETYKCSGQITDKCSGQITDMHSC